MKKIPFLLIFLSFSILIFLLTPLLSCTKGNIKTEYIYRKEGDKEILISKIEYNKEGNKITKINYFDNREISKTSYEYNRENKLIKSTTLMDATFGTVDLGGVNWVSYTTTYIYDDKGREAGFKNEGESSRLTIKEVEYKYEDGNKPTKGLEYIGQKEGEKILAFTVDFKYDNKGNKIEEIRKAVIDSTDLGSFREITRYEYDKNNILIKSITSFSNGELVYIHKYDFF